MKLSTLDSVGHGLTECDITTNVWRDFAEEVFVCILPEVRGDGVGIEIHKGWSMSLFLSF